MNPIKLSIIIVSWNTRELLRRCLASIYQHQENLAMEIFVVDNASADHTADMVRENFPFVRLIANAKNFGFAAANNQAIEQAGGEYVLLLNPDTEIMADSLQKCLAFAQSHDDSGALGCKIINPDGTLQPSVRRLPTPWPIILVLLKIPALSRGLGRKKPLPAMARYLALDFDYKKTQTAEQIMGAFMLIKKSVLTEVRLLDEKFFLWFEEVDLCRRIQKSGRQIYYYSEAAIIHYGGQSFAQEGTIKNQWRFFISALKYFF